MLTARNQKQTIFLLSTKQRDKYDDDLTPYDWSNMTIIFTDWFIFHHRYSSLKILITVFMVFYLREMIHLKCFFLLTIYVHC